MFDDLINRTDKSIKELDNKINQQPYILYNKVKMYFKKPSSDLEVIQLNDTEFDLKYYYHNIKSNVQVIDKYDGDIHEKLDHLLNDIDNYINKVEKNQIIKTINFSFNIDTSSNFNDEYLVDKMIDNYIINNINNRYRNYEIISKTRESNNNSKLYSIELNYNNRTIIEYYLIFNVFCINLTQNDYINSSMRNIIAKMMLSLNLCLDYQNPFLNFTNDNLKQAFEIKEKTEDININKYSVETNENKVSEQINNQLNKFINLLKNYNKANEDINFNTNQIFNFLLLGNNSREKEETLNHIQNLFIEYKIFGENIDIFEFDVKKEYLSNKNIVSILNKNIKSNNIIYINNFDYISKTNEEIENNFVLSLNDLVHNDKIKCIIISGKKEETLKILNHVNNLIESFSYKIILEDYSIDKIYDILINKIENSNYKIAFEEANAKEIIKKLYKQSEEKNDSFINKLYTKMFQNVLENDLTEFNTNCFPTISDENNINISINELNNLIGLENVKKEVKKLISFWKYRQKIENKTNIKDTTISLNMFFTGNPGTGKTTVARIIADILYNLEYIKESKVIEVTPNDLVADYEGQTKTKTKEILKQSQNGVLFIDEAYLFLNSQSSYFREALVEILKYLENPNNIVFFAGYSNLMKKFIDVNPGLKSRIGYFLNFEDYNLEELVKILQYKLNKKGLIIEEDALENLKPIIEEKMKIKDFGNARYIDKLITSLMIKHSENLENSYSEDKLLVLNRDDINKEELLSNELKSSNTFGFIKENGDVK